jgi:membrane fusion protein, multidrug efflux system
LKPVLFMKTEIENTETESTNTAAFTGVTMPANRSRASRRNRYTVMATVAVLLAAGLALGVIPRLRAQTRREAVSREISLPIVSITNASRVKSAMELLLPGDVHAFERTKIYARADGYLLKWNVDIGAKVHSGQILGEIDSPELDQELNQSRAALAQAKANFTLARSSAERWEGLLKDRAVSQQEVEERTGALAARAADVNAAEAAVLRLEKLTSFKKVRAPFAGTITRRFVDTGALIRAGGNASALFELAQTDTLRIHVNVPQAYLRDISTGATVQVRVAEYPDRVFAGTILRTSGAFDETTRTLLTEIETPNHDGALYPGIHVDVQLSLAQSNPPIVVPATAVMTGSEGLQVAAVDEGDAIRLQKVQVGRDLGRNMEIISGLKEGARIVTHPSDALTEGTLVKIAEPRTATNEKKLAKR